MESLNKLSPRDFEEMVARLLSSFGWEVSLTPPGRDSGVDIIGVTKDPSGLESTWAIECKNFRADHPANISIVHQLIGVREALGFDNALLVTSGGITAEARSLAERTHGIHLVDRDLLAVWLARKADTTLGTSKPKAFASCFVSYSSADTEFADYLVQRLRREGVRVWYAADQMSPGQKIVDQIEAAIGTFDRVLVVLSDVSITSKWVTTEVRKAFARQKEEKRQILFPVSLVSFDKLKKWESIDPDSGEDLALELRSYFIPDFSKWRAAAAFDEQFVRLLEGLRTSR